MGQDSGAGLLGCGFDGGVPYKPVLGQTSPCSQILNGDTMIVGPVSLLVTMILLPLGRHGMSPSCNVLLTFSNFKQHFPHCLEFRGTSDLFREF